MKKILIVTTFMLVSVVFISSCASIVSKSSYPISITTKPDGATVSILDKNGKEIYKGLSPATVTLKSGMGYFKKAEYQIKLSAVGYPEKIVPVNFKINGWYFGNLLLGGLLGMLVIDPLTGAMWKIENATVNEDLGRLTTSADSPALKIVDIHNVPDQLKENLVRIN